MGRHHQPRALSLSALIHALIEEICRCDDPRPVQSLRRGSQSRRPRFIDGVPLIDCASLTQVPESQTQIITNLMQLYKNDFLEFAWVGSRYGEVGPDARFT